MFRIGGHELTSASLFSTFADQTDDLPSQTQLLPESQEGKPTTVEDYEEGKPAINDPVTTSTQEVSLVVVSLRHCH